MVFKEIVEKPRRVNLDACKLITEQSASLSMSWTTTFSIRLKERGPEHLRSFVQIEFEDLNRTESASSNVAGGASNNILLQLESTGAGETGFHVGGS
jgi:hypothetical protein